MRRKWMSALLALALAGALSVPALAAGPESGSAQALSSGDDGTHRYPISVNGESIAARACVMVPLRAVAEPLGYTVTWDNGRVLVDDGTLHATVTIGVDRYVLTTSREDLVGMSAPFSLGAAPYVVDGVTYVPLGLFQARLGNREGAVMLDGDRVLIQSHETELANPFVRCGSLAEAEQMAGFSLELPDALSGWTAQPAIRAVEGAMIEVTCQDRDRALTVRKATGSQDISGDYRVYDSERTVTADGCRITVKEADGRAAVAVWLRDGYTYAVSAEPGLEISELPALAAAIR